MHRFYRASRLVIPFLGITAGLWLICAATVTTAQGAEGAAPKTTKPEAASSQSATRRITLDVEVTDKEGHHIRGLQAQDFTLLDNKQQQKLLSFRAVDPGKGVSSQVRIVLVVDMINSDFDTVSREREQLGEFLKENGGRMAHPTSVALLTDDGIEIERDTTMDGNAMQATLNNTNSNLRIIGRRTGYYGAVDRLEMSLSQVSQLAAYEETQPGRKLFLVISPGWPLLDWVGMQEDMKQRAWTFHSIEELTNGLREAHITLYALQPYELGRVNPFYYQTYLKPVANIGQAEYPDLALQVLAEHSGGLVEVTGKSISDEINDAVRDANSYYDLTFDAPAGTHPDDYHGMQVKTDKPGLSVRTFAGYYAQAKPATEAKEQAQ